MDMERGQTQLFFSQQFELFRCKVNDFVVYSAQAI